MNKLLRFTLARLGWEEPISGISRSDSNSVTGLEERKGGGGGFDLALVRSKTAFSRAAGVSSGNVGVSGGKLGKAGSLGVSCCSSSPESSICDSIRLVEDCRREGSS